MKMSEFELFTIALFLIDSTHDVSYWNNLSPEELYYTLIKSAITFKRRKLDKLYDLNIEYLQEPEMRQIGDVHMDIVFNLLLEDDDLDLEN